MPLRSNASPNNAQRKRWNQTKLHDKLKNNKRSEKPPNTTF